jgi:hypothetical protein
MVPADRMAFALTAWMFRFQQTIPHEPEYNHHDEP